MIIDLIKEHKKRFFNIAFLLVYCLTINLFAGYAGQISEREMADYLLALSQQIVEIAKKLLELDEILIYKLKKKFPIDYSRVASKTTSANRQIEMLLERIIELQNTLPFGYDKQSDVKELEREFQNLMNRHLENIQTISKLNPELGKQLSVARIRKPDGEPLISSSNTSSNQLASGITNVGTTLGGQRVTGAGGISLPSSISGRRPIGGGYSVPGLPDQNTVVPQLPSKVGKRDRNTSLITEISTRGSNSKADFAESPRDGF